MPNAAQNAQRWAIAQRRKARSAAAAQIKRVDDERRDEIARLQQIAAMMELRPAMAGTRAAVLDRIAQLQETFSA
jgi:hypothetical protein